MREHLTTDIPPEWHIETIGSLATTLSAGGTPSRANPAYWKGPYPFVMIEDVTGCGLYLDSTQGRISDEGLAASSAWLVPAGAVLVSMYATIGATAVTRIVAATNQAIAAIIPRDGVLPEFLALSIRHYRDALSARNVQSTQKNINKGILESFEIPLPPLEEQRKIAMVLGKAQATMTVEDDLARVARELKQAALRQLFTCGLRADAIRESRFGAVPAAWGEAVLSECAYVQTGIAKNSKNHRHDDILIPYLRVANVQDGRLDLREMKMIQVSAKEAEACLLQVGDVVLTEGGDFDKLGRGFIWEGQIERCIHQNHVFAVRTNRDLLDSRFFAYLAQSPYGKAYFLSVAHKTTNLACINTTKLRAFPVLLPPPEEQREIASLLATLDAKIAHHEARQGLLRELFRTLLHDLLTARRRVTTLALPDHFTDAGKMVPTATP